MLETICQIVIALTGALGIAMICHDKPWNKWGHLVALSGQWAWLVTTWHHKQWGILVLALWYTYHWALGCYNFIIKPRRLQKCSRIEHLMNNSEQKVFEKIY